MQKTTLLFLGMVLLVCGALLQQRRSRVQSRTMRTKGTIVEKGSSERRAVDAAMTEAAATTNPPHQEYYAVVHFTTGLGEVREFRTRLTPEQFNELAADSEVSVVYDPLNPDRVRMSADIGQRTATIATMICVIIGACFFLYGLIELSSH